MNPFSSRARDFLRFSEMPSTSSGTEKNYNGTMVVSSIRKTVLAPGIDGSVL